ncbi:hypothetical protein QWI17_05075 [Gilvimarinus sp. SDUM040013]|uniref:Fungal lipase-type domain-containing protein n=1 Tax=Gilvimarinus gilvus TaxID=3058038 RepID=A0ABU4RYE7_9GAMM|nr:hypothetical protein [Gilvimarinus sp. SDUM040013]MDO3385208.1 hypothetical protein [Gilvimarinus sp. SDUM040013]MDX6849191.1 hypothetical protein [Gilvimarinus sp. SDUM040013]
MAGFSKEIAGVQMTLAGLAYLDSGHSIEAVRKKLNQALSRTDYATAGRWQLVWGPVVHGDGDNLMYLAYNPDTTDYSIVLRGTVEEAGSIWEDVPDGQDDFPYLTQQGAKVSSHFLEAQKALLCARDDRLMVTLGEYLGNRAKAKRVYVTGHSQGAGLVSMFQAWFDHVNRSIGLGAEAAGYAFAPPTAGNPTFAAGVGALKNYYAVINPLDVVPFGYADIKRLISDKVPDAVPVELEPLIYAAAEEVSAVGAWQHPSTVVSLAKVQLPANIGYLDQIAAQHNHNSYLYLLGAPQTDGSPSILPKYQSE